MLTNLSYLIIIIVLIIILSVIWFGNSMRLLFKRLNNIFSFAVRRIYYSKRKYNFHSIMCCRNVILSPDFEEEPEWLQILKKELDRLPLGQMVFNPPSEMKQGKKERLTLRISRDTNFNILDALKGNGIPKVEEIKISEFMKVRLNGENFEITQLNEEQQIVGYNEYTEWAWDVLPKKFGKLVLHLKVTLRIRLPFGEEVKDHPIIDREVKVKVGIVYSLKIFIAKNWKWIITALIIPIIGWSVKMLIMNK